MIVKIGKTEGIIPFRELINRDRFKIGDPVRAILLDVDKDQKGPQILLSRTHPEFVRKLFEQEVPGDLRARRRDQGDRPRAGLAHEDHASSATTTASIRSAPASE